MRNRRGSRTVREKMHLLCVRKERRELMKDFAKIIHLHKKYEIKANKSNGSLEGH